MKRAPGTGSVTSYRDGKSGMRWRFRPPGAAWERAGYRTQDAAEVALDAYLKGVKPVRRRRSLDAELRRTITKARRLANEIGLTLEAAMLSLRV